jgi:ATP-dependent RNA helicase DOB1
VLCCLLVVVLPLQKVETLEDRLLSHRLHKSDKVADLYSKYEHKMQLEEQINQLRLDIKNASQDVAMKATLKSMKRVLRRLGHTTEDNVIDLKGRVACEISTCDELLG